MVIQSIQFEGACDHWRFWFTMIKSKGINSIVIWTELPGWLLTT